MSYGEDAPQPVVGCIETADAQVRVVAHGGCTESRIPKDFTGTLQQRADRKGLSGAVAAGDEALLVVGEAGIERVALQ